MNKMKGARSGSVMEESNPQLQQFDYSNDRSVQNHSRERSRGLETGADSGDGSKQSSKVNHMSQRRHASLMNLNPDRYNQSKGLLG